MGITLTFTGDIGFDHYMDRKWEDEQLIAEDVLAFLHDSDHVIANVEGPLVDRDTALVHCAEERLLHSIDPAAVPVLQRMHADIWNLVNNHMMDAGAEGVRHTLEEAKKAGARTIGAGMNSAEARRPVFLEGAGGIGMFGIGYRRGCKPAGEETPGCFLWNEMDSIRETIKEIKQTCRWCVLVVHGGEEFTALPSPYVRERYLQFLEMGADAIVCHHPHVPMNYETVNGKQIFYSLGNFIFDTDYQRAQYHTEEGVVLKLRFTEEAYTFEAQGIRIDREKERIVSGKLPTIFTEVPAEEYEKFIPLATQMFLAATKRQQRFLYPETFAQATDAEWETHFLDPHRAGRVEGEALDFRILYPLAKEAEKGAWKESCLEEIRAYLLEQMDS